MASPKVIFGTGIFTRDAGFDSPEDVQPWLDVLLKNKAEGRVSEVDMATAVWSPEAERLLGPLQFGSHFAIGAKLLRNGGVPSTSAKEKVMAQAKEILSRLGVKQVKRPFLTGALLPVLSGRLTNPVE